MRKRTSVVRAEIRNNRSEDSGKRLHSFRLGFRSGVLCGHAVLDDATIKQVNGAICVLSETLVVRDHANRGAPLVQFAEQMHYRFAVVRIEVTSRLVCKQDRRSARKGAGNCDALLLTTGQLARQMFCPMRHPDTLQRFSD